MADNVTSTSDSRARMWTFGMAAVVMFGFACFSLYKDRTATAAISAAFCLTLIILQQMPNLESLEVFTLKAKFARKIEEAERILEQTRRNAAIAAGFSFHQFAWMNRMGAPSWTRRRELSEGMASHLLSIGIDPLEVNNLKRPLLAFAALDLLRVFESSLDESISVLNIRINEAIETLPKPLVVSSAEYQRLDLLRQHNIRARRSFSDPEMDSSLHDIRSIIELRLKDFIGGPVGRETLERVGEEVSVLSDQCWHSSSVTAEAAKYLDHTAGKTYTRLVQLHGRDFEKIFQLP